VRNRHLVAVAAALAASLALGSRAEAAPVAVTGAGQIAAAPATVARGALESNSWVRVIDESSVTLGASLTLWTIGASGTLTQTTYTAQTCVHSHLLHFDAVGTATNVSLTGTATFSQNVIGVVPLNDVITRALDNTDGPTGPFPFGRPGTTYPTPGDSARGFEPLAFPSADSLTLPSPATVGFVFRTDGFDQVRVLTTCDPSPVVPEFPISVLAPLGAVGVLAGVAWARRRQRSITIA
jgi:hypothetical protein